MRKILATLFAFVAATCTAQTAPIGVCISNVAQTISNGFIAPVPFASVTLCSQNSTSSNCAANIVSVYTSTTLGTPTPTNPVTADAGGNYFFCAPVGHYALMIAGSQGGFFVPDIALVDDWSRGGSVTGNWSLTGNLTAANVTASGNVTAGALSGSTGHCAQIGSGGTIAATGFPCGSSSATGTVTNVSIGSGFPSWFTLGVTNSTTTPTINATVSTIPNSALTNSTITINTVPCTLGSTCSVSGTPRTCSTNGCFSIDADGTIHQDGSAAGCATSDNASCTVAVTFPTAFASTTNMRIVPGVVASGTEQCYGVIAAPTTTGFSIAYSSVTYVGGGGTHCTGGQTANWIAIGN